MRRVILGAVVAALAIGVFGAQASAGGGEGAAKHRGKKVSATNFDFTPPTIRSPGSLPRAATR